MYSCFQEFYTSKQRREPAKSALVFSSQPHEERIADQQPHDPHPADEENQLLVAATPEGDTDLLDSEDECYYSDGDQQESLDILRTEEVRAYASLESYDVVDALGLDDM